VKYLPYYTEEERRRHKVRPGLTGLAQINGRNTAIWEKRFAFDVQYVDNISFFADLRILAETVGLVLRREDIGQGVDAPQDFHVYRELQQR
jgi:lipopolysaccharide/colanic/teichoic acid biosynthesis glycosyltransferase